MGDRGNIIIEKDNAHFHAPLFFYTHWNGSEIKQTLQEALKRGKGRWTDPSYLARIIFCEMVKGSILNETGYGISNRAQDNEHDYLCVNIEKQEVRVVKYDYQDEKTHPTEGKELHKWSFEEFCALDLEEVEEEVA